MNVLLVTLDNPFAYGSGSFRLAKLVRWLAKGGARITVLTVADGAGEPFDQTASFTAEGRVTIDVVPLRQRPSAAEVLRRGLEFTSLERAREPSTQNIMKRRARRFLHSLNFLDFPDRGRACIQPLVERGLALAVGVDFDLIYSSACAGTVSGHFAARTLQRRLELPWVQEYRDLWVGNPWRGQQPYPWRSWIEQRWERELLRKADRTVVMNAGNVDILVQRHGAGLAGRIVVVPNGFDPLEFPDQATVPASPPLRITYVGGLYGGRRDLKPFFEALRDLRNSGRAAAGEIEFRYAGPDGRIALAQATGAGVADSVRDLGRLRPSEAKGLLVESHLLLLVEVADDTPWIRGHLPGKAYEYLGARRPILALAHPAGSIAALYAETGAGAMFHPTDVRGIRDHIEVQLCRLRSGEGGMVGCTPEASVPYQWSAIAGTLRQLLESVRRGRAGARQR